MNSTKTFKTIDDRIANLCLNNINVTGDIGVNNDAQLGITQTCGSSSQKAANPAVAEQVNPVSPVSPNTSTPDEATPDAGTADAGTADEATPDAGTADAATPPVVSDEGTTDAATPPVVADAATPDETTPDEGTADAAIMQTSSSNTKIYIIVGVVILICIIAIIFFMKYKKNRL
jgi:cobalamin biosynthesis Mg chelatase CobN